MREDHGLERNVGNLANEFRAVAVVLTTRGLLACCSCWTKVRTQVPVGRLHGAFCPEAPILGGALAGLYSRHEGRPVQVLTPRRSTDSFVDSKEPDRRLDSRARADLRRNWESIT